MKRDLVLYIIAMALSSVVVALMVEEGYNGFIWQATIIAYDLSDSLFTFVTYGLNPVFFLLLWVGMGAIFSFMLHLMFDNGEETC